ncbi:MAG: DUF2127 domain-containing protein [Actinomycetota bacterium]|nr:DUF2127 domain-containing protein [Actinomycetota bacterium]MDQ2959170.1 DUF2127 domain-containing protein [Actinomycetota bacterium]
MDWNLRACSRSGHVTYAPDEVALRQRLEAGTPLGDAWRCLRCGCYILGEPHGSGPAEDAPGLLRGRALRSAFILRFLAIERFVRGGLILLLGLAVLQFKSSQVSVRQIFDKDLSAAKPLLNQLGWNASDSGLIHSVESALNARRSTLTLVAAFLIFYGVLQLIEGVGLWLLKRWGEYFAVVATSLFLPLEIYELTEKITVLRVGAFLLNLAAVLYLLLSKRLFGLRGGHRAYQAQLHEASLLEVQESSQVDS